MTPLSLPDDDALAEMLPVNRPVTTSEAMDIGLTYRQLRRLVDVGLIQRRVPGVVQRSDMPDTVATRLAVLKLVAPTHCVVTDRTAGWLWAGDRIQAPNDHLAPSPLSVFCRPGHRLRNKLTQSGERTFAARDLIEMDSITVSTELRTACDLGRLLPRDQAFAALDTMLGVRAFDRDELLAEIGRFNHYRGVVQLRWMSALADARSDSQFESITRLRWYDAGLPTPELQVEVPTPWGASYWLDLGLEEELFAAEYDGEKFHGDERAQPDASRRDWMRFERHWRIEVFRTGAMVGPRQRVESLLTAAWMAHCAERNLRRHR